MLISQMLREMKDSMTAEQESGGFGADIMGDTVNTEFSMALSRSGGLGLAESLMKSLQKLDPKGAGQVESTAPVIDGLTMPSADPRSLSSDPAISSSFGWRADPLHGHRKFHNGTDIKLAYGEEVRAAAAGVVTFAGEQPGYGLVVKVDHGDGLETRYAHLSSTDVRQGMSIEAGSAIARSGNSGRTTGPHLHFEVRKDGQPIDPERVIGFVPVAVTDVSATR
ncbi:MAG TPA: peptidoglycan DD-metalloendopeptidase family protein [Vicinamibacterales bacterium]|nr:peptidoglycan DD-metalloendopeptidase family protein [Vicinamibacterales bacterium]